ncbi:glucosamine-6-phosphate deaminase [Clostridium celatum]|uniref:Glucosamine-6-phosphate deaminase n=1 Tax=Clostridium celatum DSM 1785 TaxID=545697 RepID=L1QCA3_9CLOT|nr:glucosamine-6-phosphate deaminase [Clostridium celatum]EKY25604.1 glucosamine-6-phosphate deaminase [Clostridium celatum DSM 1785]MCE9655482.1 glucosamine-6-phosphate deaminase [Clostridium celatum]MDU2266521.1 glucosamine-6-phosphate deaminase [Clostridium celatum]MDU3722103.1 glucosamine-6-phosphate deaminase [Clostridium celatum]MDU6296861.1 glucosamine-6-phosphate deaminase [Clostridium celatum]
MKLIVVENYEELSKVAAQEYANVIKENPKAVLGLATGGSPIGMYKELIKMYENKELDFSNVTTVNLDEYVGLNPEHEQSYRHFMNENLFKHINVDITKTFVPNGLAEDLAAQCKEYDEKIKELGGIDVQLLGIGNNGHIAFNEPDTELSAGTHVISLTQNTIEANARFFDNIDDVPKTAITMGVGGIMKAKKIILIASGESKAEAIKGIFSGKITTENPASMLQMHRDAVVIVDKDAAKLLNY